MQSCKEPPQPNVPNGTYVTSSKEESVIVQGRKITFRVFVDDARTKLSDRTTEFYLWPEGTLVPYTLASQEMLTGIGKFDWSWDGIAIRQSDPRRPDRAVTIFERQSGKLGSQ